MKKQKRYYFKLPGYFHALGPIGPMWRYEVREWILHWLKVDRLPYGTEIWPTD